MNAHGTRMRVAAVVAGLGLSLGGAACGDDGSTTTAPSTTAPPVIDPGDGGSYHPVIDPADFVATIDNPYLPFREGARWEYEGMSDGEVETTTVVVTAERKEVMGVSTVVVRDTVRSGGQLVEDTYDWFAQDREGNVWYFGEAVRNYDNGKLVDGDGSWEAGVDGALPGIVMPADPTVGHAYRQEFYEGEAEDLAEILRTGEQKTVPFGAFDDVVVTRDWNPLEPAVVEEKYYAPGVGVIFETAVAGAEERSELVDFSPGS